MKTFTKYFLMMMAFVSSIIVFGQVHIPVAQEQKIALDDANVLQGTSIEMTRDLELPFFEGWDNGSFASQGWHFNNQPDNWVIRAHVGNPEPSAEFTWDPLLENDYTSTLTSDSLMADMMTEGGIFLDFDLKLDDRNSTGEEKMLVEIFNDSIWIQVAEFANNGSFDFTSNHINITEHVMGHVFSVRFNAMGQNSFDILSWFVDNISVYRECAAPLNLVGYEIWDTVHQEDVVVIGWEVYMPPTSQWFYYDDESIEYVWGDDSEAWEANVAIKVEAEDLVDMEGAAVTKYRAFVDSRLMGAGTISVKVYQGDSPDPSVPMYEEDVTDQFVVGDDWNDFIFSQAVPIDYTQPLWIGMYFTGQANTFGPGITADMGSYEPNGDLIWDAGTWDHLVSYGAYNRAWLLRGYVTKAYGSTVAVGNTKRSQSYFNIYRKIYDEDDYELIATVDAEPGVGSYCYYDWNADPLIGYCWQVTAVYENSSDTCESAPAMAYELPMDDCVCVYLNDINARDASALTNLYPNPAKDMVTVTSNAPMKQVTITNYVGQIVFTKKLDKATSVELNTGSYRAGVYLVRIDTEIGVVTKRVVIGR